MPRERPASATLSSTAHNSVNRFTTRSLSAAEERLASVERELKVQFERIAQLQAELDQLVATIRRSPTGVLLDTSGSPQSGIANDAPRTRRRPADVERALARLKEIGPPVKHVRNG